jgi:flotillin
MGMAALSAVFVAKQFLYVCPPNRVLIFSGRENLLPDGSSRGYRVTHGGMAWRVPLLEKVDRMDLTVMPILLHVKNAYSQGGIPLEMKAVAYVKVSSDGVVINHAIERFLGRDPKEIRQVAKETLEGHVRGILARMTPEEVNEDRLKFAAEMVEETKADFDRLGLTLDALKIQSVSDEVSYLDSIGRQRLANVLASAEIAESAAKADAEEEQADANQRAQVSNESAETAIKRSANAYRQAVAEFEAKAKSAEERAEQEALAARAIAEQDLQHIRAKLEHLRLMADVVLPADAEKTAKELMARAEAATIAADGKALAEVLQMMSDVWLEAGGDAKEIYLIQQLETVVATVTERVKNMEIGEVTLLDGGDGNALAQHAASMPSTVAAILREFRDTTGVDIPSILTGSSQGVAK